MASERIDPLFFGIKDRRLFGCHHAPSQGPAPKLGVVIAPAVGHEYSRAHRALRQLAGSCAVAGLRALRFDFSSTGDSQGDRWPESLGPWREDLEHALRELASRTRVARTALLGVRVSASLAVDCAARNPGCAALVLWDPCFDGAAHEQSLRQAQERFEASLASPIRRAGQQEAGVECLGFHWPAALLGELREWRAPSFEQGAPQRVLILESALSPRASELALLLGKRGARVSHEVSRGSQPWNDEVDQGLVPAVDLARIVDFLREES
ncbi:MAG TPA: hypothetical protein VK843_19885 [Planctomycetota bacterium]|nr:hypothetical protein [Planctomycetota bacterium]